jgi:hypothetical protein
MVWSVESIVDRDVSLRNRLGAICDSLALFCAMAEGNAIHLLSA